MRLRTGRVVVGWSVIMAGLALTGVLLTTSGSQARMVDPTTGARKTAVSAARYAPEASTTNAHARSGYARDARSGDSFNAVVRHLQSRDGVENTSPPFMWLASLAVNLTSPAGVHDLRLATFQGHRLVDVAADARFDALVSSAADDGWVPLLRVRSKKNHELVSIHTRTRGQKVSLLLVTVDNGEAVVAQVGLDPDVLAEWIKEPDKIDERLR